MRVISSAGSEDSPFLRHRRPSSSLGRVPDESREHDTGLAGIKGSISSGLLPRRRGRVGTGSLDSIHQFSSDGPGTVREAPAAGLSASSPIGIGRIGAENVPLRPQVKYGRRNAEGTYNFDEENVPRKPKIQKYGSGDWESDQRALSVKSEPNSPVSAPLLEALGQRRNSDGMKKESPRHLGPLTELAVVDEDSNEGCNESSNEDNTEGEKGRPKKRRISSCSSGEQSLKSSIHSFKVLERL